VPGGSTAVSSSSRSGLTASTVADLAPSHLDLAAMAADQQRCQPTLLLAASSSLQVSAVKLGDYQLLCDSSTGRQRPLVPLSWRQAVMAAVHQIGHPGTRATRRLISSRFVWKGLAADVTAFCRSCLPCQRAKVTRQPAAPVQPIDIPGRRFSHIHVDLVGPLPTSKEGFSYLLTVMDRSTRWLEAVPLASVTAQSTADALVSTWISRFGVPEQVTSDRGVQFVSAIWKVLCTRLGIKQSFTTAYHPQSNGMVERVHRQLKDALRARLAGSEWPSHLPWILLGLRSAPKEDSNTSSAELVYGVPLALPGELLSSPELPAVEFLQLLRQQPPQPLPTRPLTYSEAASAPSRQLLEATYVFVRRGAVSSPLAPQYDGPYLVKQRGQKVFQVEMGGRLEVVSVDRLKPYLGQPVDPALPPRRGRPPLSS